jgi:hypothetical protein
MRSLPPLPLGSLALVALALVPACGGEETSPAPTPGTGGAGPATSTATGTGAAGGGGGTGGEGGAVGGGGEGGAPIPCNAKPLGDTSGLVEIAFDADMGTTTTREQGWAITVNEGTLYEKTYVIADETLHEAVRFELAHPARVHGMKIRWADVDRMPRGTGLRAGLYGDFGHNGFDFWAADPLWTGARCSEDATAEDGWLSYEIDPPIEIPHPGLVYAAHRSQPGEPVWLLETVMSMDMSPCGKFDACQSSLNMPEAEKATYFNGLSFPLQHRFVARLYVEYTAQQKPADKLFQPVAGAPSGGHVSWGDYDADGDDDFLLGASLWRNDAGVFTDVTATAFAGAGAGATGGVWGDYDNDGCLDVFLFFETQTQPDVLLRNKCDGTFADVTLAAGIVDSQTYNPCDDPVNNKHSPSAAAAWLDVDADGLLDLYVANFICWPKYTYYYDTVFRNKGGGAFEEITGQKGFFKINTPSRGAAPVDFDRDGDVDLFVNNYVLKANLLYRNNGDGTVSEVAKAVGAAGKDTMNYYGHTIGAAWGDLDNDGDFDLVAANLAHPRFFHFSDKTEILLQKPGGLFEDITGDFKTPASAAGLRYQETHSVPVLADVDQDGNLDLAITCVYDGRPTDFYWGKGDGTFTLDAYGAGITTENGWGAAVADFDLDGDMDLFATSLFANTLDASKKGHFLQVRVVGTTANRAAIGATVAVKTGATTRIRHVQGGSGKGGQDSLYLHFGLGTVASVDEIQVTLPGGKKLTYAGPFAADQRLWLYEDETAPLAGWKPPK